MLDRLTQKSSSSSSSSSSNFIRSFNSIMHFYFIIILAASKNKKKKKKKKKKNKRERERERDERSSSLKSSFPENALFSEKEQRSPRREEINLLNAFPTWSKKESGFGNDYSPLGAREENMGRFLSHSGDIQCRFLSVSLGL